MLKIAELLPSTCFVNKSLVHFVAGYRDSAAKKLHIQEFISQIPECDVMLSCFAPVMDNPDIAEAMTKVWKEDVVDKCKESALDKQIAWYRGEAEKMLSKCWPLLHTQDVSQLFKPSLNPLKELTL